MVSIEGESLNQALARRADASEGAHDREQHHDEGCGQGYQDWGGQQGEEIPWEVRRVDRRILGFHPCYAHGPVELRRTASDVASAPAMQFCEDHGKVALQGSYLTHTLTLHTRDVRGDALQTSKDSPRPEAARDCSPWCHVGRDP